MRKVSVFAKAGIDRSHLENQILTEFDAVLSETPEYVFTFGGDGTFLEAIQIYGFEPIYIPINMGNLGFYTSWVPNELGDLLLNFEKCQILNLSTLRIEYEHKGVAEVYHALNEATIVNPIKTQVLNIFIDGYEFEKFRGTGICLSTPTGSTAYNKSLSGAIIQSSLNLLQVTKIAPINNRVYRSIDNSLILGVENEIEVRATRDEFKHSTLTMDRKVVSLDDITSPGIKICLSEQKIKIMVKEENNFWSRVKKAFL
ncbi:NAD(+)/NADH kinase [Mollicutes bacterium LVI A0039]|nr:NAD(+)/NADH kinase [Mollicutes bacterium LVI A0039]